jgi:CO/xanthine dehydrogenase Mo-binding subunit
MKASVFLEDIYPQNLLYAVTIRSPVAKGSLKLIDFPKLPPNYTTITAADIPGENRLEDTAMPILAHENLSYIGEPVALILGQDRGKLEEFAARCNVIVDEEKPVFSCEDNESDNEENYSQREIQIGSTSHAFEKAAKIVTGSYVTGIQDHWYAEPAGAVTWFKHENKASGGKESDKKKTFPNRILVIKTATQWPYHVKRSVAMTLGCDMSSVSVEPTNLSLHMDGKLWYPSLIACHAALGTYITKKPVRLILSREEDFLFSPKRCRANIDILTAVDDNGNISAADIEIFVNLGAFGVNNNEILDQVCLGSMGNYNIENLKLTAKAKKTNLPPQGPFSGFGLSQGIFAIERHISQIADMYNLDPAQWRKNHINLGKNQIAGSELIDFTAKSSDYYRKWASYELLRQSGKEKTHEKGENPRGIGIALGFQGNGLLYYGGDHGIYSIEVTLTKDGTLEIDSSFNSPEDYAKLWEKIAVDILSIEPDMVRIVSKNSPDCGPSCASRNITAITKLVEKCCHTIKKQRSRSPLPVTVRRSVKPQNGSLLNNNFTAPEGKVMDVSGFLKPSQACAVVEVSIDIVDCIPKIRGVWLGIAGGKIISVNRARRSLTRSAVQALGWSFMECIEYMDGVIPVDQYRNFLIPSPADIPPIYVDFLEDENDETRGIGELPFSCIPAAFLQAVSQAMDYSFKSIPIKRKDIWEMIRLRNTAPQAGAK